MQELCDLPSAEINRIFEIVRSYLDIKLLRVPGVIGIANGISDVDRNRPSTIIVYSTNEVVRDHIPRFLRITWRESTYSMPVQVALVKGFMNISALKGLPKGDPLYSKAVRPAMPGYSIGAMKETGTIGFVLTDRESPGQKMILSNNHILNPDNKIFPHIILQPGSGDHCHPYPIGRLSSYFPLSLLRRNRMDAAISIPDRQEDIESSYPILGPLKGHHTTAEVGWRVYKVGRTSGFTEGVIQGVNWNGFVNYPFGRFFFTGQVVIRNPSQPIAFKGDSGSGWVSPDRYAVALSFAGDNAGHHCIATPIDIILRAFKTRIATPNKNTDMLAT